MCGCWGGRGRGRGGCSSYLQHSAAFYRSATHVHVCREGRQIIVSDAGGNAQRALLGVRFGRVQQTHGHTSRQCCVWQMLEREGVRCRWMHEGVLTKGMYIYTCFRLAQTLGRKILVATYSILIPTLLQ